MTTRWSRKEQLSPRRHDRLLRSGEVGPRRLTCHARSCLSLLPFETLMPRSSPTSAGTDAPTGIRPRGIGRRDSDIASRAFGCATNGTYLESTCQPASWMQGDGYRDMRGDSRPLPEADDTGSVGRPFRADCQIDGSFAVSHAPRPDGDKRRDRRTVFACHAAIWSAPHPTVASTAAPAAPDSRHSKVMLEYRSRRCRN